MRFKLLARAFGLGAVVGCAVALAPAGYLASKLDPVKATLLIGGITAAIALTALSIALFTIRANRHIAKATATLNHIARCEADEDIIKARRAFRAVPKGQIANYAAEDKETDETTVAINTVLNDFELIAIGIKRGIIDCELFRKWNEKSVVRYWRRGAPYVIELRERLKANELFCEFEEMANAWDVQRAGYKVDKQSPFCQ